MSISSNILFVTERRNHLELINHIRGFLCREIWIDWISQEIEMRNNFLLFNVLSHGCWSLDYPEIWLFCRTLQWEKGQFALFIFTSFNLEYHHILFLEIQTAMQFFFIQFKPRILNLSKGRFLNKIWT